MTLKAIELGLDYLQARRANFEKRLIENRETGRRLREALKLVESQIAFLKVGDTSFPQYRRDDSEAENCLAVVISDSGLAVL